MNVVRSATVFASWDGAQTLTISTAEHFDPDDCLAQMILHEICHALIEGPAGQAKSDWGLENIDARHRVHEHACHRLQAALSGPFGLRQMMAPTTEHRPYYEALPPNPLSAGTDPAIPMAQRAWPAATTGPWADAISQALSATAAIADTLRAFDGDSLWAAALPRHPSALPPAPIKNPPCQQCAWFQDGHCGRAKTTIPAQTPGCHYWQGPLSASDCAHCGACCRQGFDVVDLDADSPLIQRHPTWITDQGWGPQLPRPQGFCVALKQRSAPYRCSVYADRPSGCRDLEVGGLACLEARQRVGLTP